MGNARSEPPTQRFQPPARPPLRELVIACLSATVGTLELVAWVTFDLPDFVAHAGGILLALALGIGVWCLLRMRALRWVVHLDADFLTIARGSRRHQVPWAEITTTEVAGSRLLIHGRSRRPAHTLHLTPGTLGAAYVAELTGAIDQRLAQHRQP